MNKSSGWLGIVGIFGLLLPAEAQTSSSPKLSAQFDGTYAFVSSTKLNETYWTGPGGHMGQCLDLRPVGPLMIVSGQVRRDGNLGFEGTVGSQGELAMRSDPPPGWHGIQPGNELTISGRVDANGMVRARLVGRRCSYGLVWQKEHR